LTLCFFHSFYFLLLLSSFFLPFTFSFFRPTANILLQGLKFLIPCGRPDYDSSSRSSRSTDTTPLYPYPRTPYDHHNYDSHFPLYEGHNGDNSHYLLLRIGQIRCQSGDYSQISSSTKMKSKGNGGSIDNNGLNIDFKGGFRSNLISNADDWRRKSMRQENKKENEYRGRRSEKKNGRRKGSMNTIPFSAPSYSRSSSSSSSSSSSTSSYSSSTSSSSSSSSPSSSSTSSSRSFRRSISLYTALSSKRHRLDPSHCDTIPRPFRGASDEAKGSDSLSDYISDKYGNESDDSDSSDSDSDINSDGDSDSDSDGDSDSSVEEEEEGRKRKRKKHQHQKNRRDERRRGGGRNGAPHEEHATQLNDVVSQLHSSTTDHPIFFFASGTANTITNTHTHEHMHTHMHTHRPKIYTYT
jgi:hypothetical protein